MADWLERGEGGNRVENLSAKISVHRQVYNVDGKNIPLQNLSIDHNQYTIDVKTRKGVVQVCMYVIFNKPLRNQFLRGYSAKTRIAISYALKISHDSWSIRSNFCFTSKAIH